MILNSNINLRAFSTRVQIFWFLTRSTPVLTWSEPERTGPHILFGTPSDLLVCPLREEHYNPHSPRGPAFRNLRLPRSTPCPRPSGLGSGHPCSHRLPVPPAHEPRPWPNWIKVKIRSSRIKTKHPRPDQALPLRSTDQSNVVKVLIDIILYLTGQVIWKTHIFSSMAMFQFTSLLLI